MTDYQFSNNEQAADCLLMPITLDQITELKSGKALVQVEIDNQLKRMLEQKTLKEKGGSTVSMPTLGNLAQAYVCIVVVEKATGSWREAFAAAASKLRNLRVSSLAIDLSSTAIHQQLQQIGVKQATKELLEGLLLSLYERQTNKKEPQSEHKLEQIRFVLNEEQLKHKDEYEHAASTANHIVESVKLARDLTNLPGNELTPERLAFYAEEVAHTFDLDIEVMDEWSCAQEGMGGLLSVGQGSANPPRMIVIHYEGNPDSTEKWGLIGKGITFDTGGISLKPAANMEDMITDMAGAAAVLATVHLIAALKLERNVIAVIPTAENMPSDRSLKPGDIITTMSGHTVEVVNTDAEGRLVLADGMTVAIKRGATKLIDVATLTGAALVALGTEATAAISNNEELMKKMIAASEKSGERVWQLPAYAEYKKLITSEVADLKNSGGRHAGTITAGMFLEHFAERKPWIHLDIAGTSNIKTARRWEPKGATGVMTRTLFELIAENE